MRTPKSYDRPSWYWHQRLSSTRPFLILASALVLFAYAPPVASDDDWLPSGLVHSDTPFYERSTDIAVGPDGSVHVVWDYGDIWWVRWIEGCKCWSTPAMLHAMNSISDEFPRISIGSDGVPWVVWSQYQPNEETWAQVSSRYIDGAWSPAEIVMTPAGSNNLFDIVAVNDGAWVVSEGPGPGGTQDIFVAQYESGKWTNRGWLNAGTDLDRDPAVAIDSSGRVWVAWVDAGSLPWRIVVSTLVSEQWTSPEAMPIGRVLPRLTAVGDTIFLVWRVDDPASGFNIAYRVWNDGWGEVGFVNEPDTTNTTDTSPSMSSFGDLGPVVAWSAGPSLLPSHRDIAFSKWTGSSWTAEQTISVPDSKVLAIDQYPQVALGPDGMAWTSWERWGPWPQNPDIDIWSARGQVYPPPTVGIAESVVSAQGALSIIRSSPNPSRGVVSTAFTVRDPGRYEVVVSDVTGRILDRFSLGALEPGFYSGDRAFRWPLKGKATHVSGVFFIAFQDVSNGRVVANGRLTLLR